MARNRRRNNNRTRDVKHIANAKISLRFDYPRRSRPYRFQELTTIEDFRRFHPRRVLQYPKSLLRQMKPRIVAKPKAYTDYGRYGGRHLYRPRPVTLGFLTPKKVLICVRRKMRKEVLHAFKKTGKGGQKRPLRTQFSNFHCGG